MNTEEAANDIIKSLMITREFDKDYIRLMVDIIFSEGRVSGMESGINTLRPEKSSE